MATTLPDFQTLIYSVDGCVARVKLNRPKKKNAMNQVMMEELGQVLQLIVKDDKVVMATFTGAGDYFSSGNDLNVFMEADPSRIDDLQREGNGRLNRFVGGLIDCPKLLIAIVNGPAVGLAVTSLAHFDLVYAADNATFHTPFSSLGQCAEACSSYLFPKMMGHSKASEILVFGRKITAQEAKERNLVTEVFPRDSLHQEVQRRIQTFKEFSRPALLESKKLLREPERKILHKVHKQEVEVMNMVVRTPECAEAIMKFFSRRQPKL